MEFSQDAFLSSSSGYALPFSSKAYPQATFIKDYGPEEDGSLNKGLDFKTFPGNYHLLGLADGKVVGISTTDDGKLSQTIRYGEFYDVLYGNLNQALYVPGQRVKAGDVVALSGKTFHIEVTYKGEQMDPKDFLRMLLGNVKGVDLAVSSLMAEDEDPEMDVPTKYDDCKDEILSMMMRFLPDMFKEIYRGKFKPADHDVQALENVLSLSNIKNIFFEKLPSLSNPFGLGEKAIPYIAKAMQIVIEIFLGFMALRHEMFPSSFDDDSKKKFSFQHGSVKE